MLTQLDSSLCAVRVIISYGRIYACNFGMFKIICPSMDYIGYMVAVVRTSFVLKDKDYTVFVMYIV